MYDKEYDDKGYESGGSSIKIKDTIWEDTSQDMYHEIRGHALCTYLVFMAVGHNILDTHKFNIP